MQYNWEQPFAKTVSLIGHKAEIIDIKISPDESFIVTTDMSGIAKIWDPKFGICLHTLNTSNHHPISCITISPDNNLIATSSGDNNIKLWDAHTGKILNIIPHPCWILATFFLSKSHNYPPILMTIDNTKIIRCWSQETGNLLKEYTQFKNCACLGIGQKNHTIISNGHWYDNDPFKIYDITSGNTLTTINDPNASGCSLDNDEKQLVTYSKHKALVWNLDTQKVISTIELDKTKESEIFSISFVDHDKLIITLKTFMTYLWNTTTKSIFFTQQAGIISHISNNNKYVIVIPKLETSEQSKIQIIEISSHKVMHEIDIAQSHKKSFDIGSYKKFLGIISPGNMAAKILFFGKAYFISSEYSQYVTKKQDINRFHDVNIRYQN